MIKGLSVIDGLDKNGNEVDSTLYDDELDEGDEMEDGEDGRFIFKY
jgi:hypothetical protein